MLKFLGNSPINEAERGHQIMDVASIAAVATNMSQANTQNAVQLAVLKKAIDIQAQGALQLIEAVAQAIPSNPPNLGNHVDVSA